MSQQFVISDSQREEINSAFAEGWAPIKGQLPVRCSEWARDNFYLSPESSGVAGPFVPWPFQPAILDCMGSDEIEVLTFLKSARVSYTKMLSAATGYFHHHKSRNVLIYQPTDSDAKKYTKETINPMIRDVPVLEELLAASSQNNKDNTLDSKFFLGSSLHILGGTSPNNFRRLTKDVVIYDELDGFVEDVGGEGDPVSLGDKRVRDSAFPKSIRGTTPTVAGRSLIEKSMKDADVAFSFHVECPDCGEAQPLLWGGEEADFGMKWEGEDPESTYYQCRECASHWRYSQLEGLLKSGVWTADDGRWIDEESKLRSHDGDVIPWVRHVGFIIWAAYSPTFSWPEIVREFLAAKGDPKKLKTFVNTTLGELWRETAVQVDHAPLLERREPYRSVPDEVRVITFGGDVQANRIEIEFVGWGPEEESWSLDYVVLEGDTERPEVWRLLLKEIARSFERPDGSLIYPLLGCLDSGYLSDDVYRFSKKVGSRFVLPVKGFANQKNIAEMSRKKLPDHGAYLVKVGTEVSKEALYRRLELEKTGPGYCHFPDSEPYGEEFFRQLTAHEKRLVRRNNQETWMYHKAYIRDEVMDCRIYNMAAIKVAQQRFRVDLSGDVLLGMQRKVSDESLAVESEEISSYEELGNLLNG